MRGFYAQKYESRALSVEMEGSVAGRGKSMDLRKCVTIVRLSFESKGKNTA